MLVASIRTVVYLFVVSVGKCGRTWREDVILADGSASRVMRSVVARTC